MAFDAPRLQVLGQSLGARSSQDAIAHIGLDRTGLNGDDLLPQAGGMHAQRKAIGGSLRLVRRNPAPIAEGELHLVAVALGVRGPQDG